MAGPSRTLPKSQIGNNNKNPKQNPDTSNASKESNVPPAVKGTTGSGAKPKRQVIPVHLHKTDRRTDNKFYLR